MVHDDYKEMLAMHALSALDTSEVRALNQHLAECAECRRELADWESVAASLALSADPAEPSPRVRERIMSAVRAEGESPQESRVVPFAPTARRNVWTAFGSIGAIAAVVLFVVLIIWIVVLWQQNRSIRREMNVLASEMRSMQEDLRQSDQFVKLMSTPGAKVAQLYGKGPGSGATAHLAYDKLGRAMLIAAHLPPAPQGKEYQLWFIVGNNPPIPGKSFTLDQMGRGVLDDRVPDQAINSAVFAITLEPAGGSTAPTSAIYLQGSL